MKSSNNTILITGAGFRIDRGLAEALHVLSNQIIIAGRGKEALDGPTSGFFNEEGRVA